VNSSAAAEWAMFALGAIGVALTALLSKYAAKLLPGKSIQGVVDSANAIIDMYDKHVKALELEVGRLKDEVAGLTAKLDETLKANSVLQRILAESPPIKLPEA
jgi:hypothetical protein